MGLDMYLVGRKYIFRNWEHPENDRTEDGIRVKAIEVDLGYWRKHPNLHGHIVQTYADGVDECQNIELSADNLRQIINVVEAKALPHTEGFFFGRSSADDEEVADDVKQLKGAIAWLEAVAPVKPLPRVEGAGFTAVLVKPEDIATRESRGVIYRASW